MDPAAAEGRPFLSLVLACYNDARTLEPSFARILQTLHRLDRSFEIIFVDDASTDDSRAILASIAGRHPDLDLRLTCHQANLGRGATVAEGFRMARGEMAGYLDVDLEIDCEHLAGVLRAIEEGADVATVQREYARAWFGVGRSVMSRTYSWLVRRMLDVPLRDTETGFKFFRRDKLGPVLSSIRATGWFWDTEFMVRAWRRGLVIREIPGQFARRADKVSTVRPMRDSIRSLWQLWRFRRHQADAP